MRQLLRLIAVLAFATTSVLVGLPASADANLITNGDFSGGPTIPGWTLTGDSSFTFVVTGGTPPQASYLLAGPPSTAELSQTFSTVSGQQYLISFDLQAQTGTDNTSSGTAFLGANFDGVGNIFSTTSTVFGWTTFSFTETALMTTSTLSFDYTNPSSFYDLTNVSVTAVPEPGVYAMMGIGLLLMAFVVRHRRNK